MRGGGGFPQGDISLHLKMVDVCLPRGIACLLADMLDEDFLYFNRGLKRSVGHHLQQSPIDDYGVSLFTFIGESYFTCGQISL